MPRVRGFHTERRNDTFGEAELVDAQGRLYKTPTAKFMMQFDEHDLRSKKVLDFKLPKRRPVTDRLPLPETDLKMTFFLPEVLEKKNMGKVVLPAARGMITELYMARGSNCGLCVVEEWLWVGQVEDDVTFKNIERHGRRSTPRV